jgi:hypothetical protein
MNIKVAVIDFSFCNRQRAPGAVSTLRGVAQNKRPPLACVWTRDPATGRLTCSWQPLAADEPTATSPRPTGAAARPQTSLAPVPLAA